MLYLLLLGAKDPDPADGANATYSAHPGMLGIYKGERPLLAPLPPPPPPPPLQELCRGYAAATQGQCRRCAGAVQGLCEGYAGAEQGLCGAMQGLCTGDEQATAPVAPCCCPATPRPARRMRRALPRDCPRRRAPRASSTWQSLV